MNTQTQEALKMAIVVMQAFNNEFPTNSAKEAIQACKEALAQPAQEPVTLHTSSNPFNSERHGLEVLRNAHPAPSWQGLDMQEIGELSFKAEEQLIRDKLPMGEYAFEFYDLIEQALKEKNT